MLKLRCQAFVVSGIVGVAALPTSLPDLRIFVSSPGDVMEERFICEKIIVRLEERYRHVCRLAPIFWEHEPLVATASFQAQIPSPAETDIVICILWSRIGTRLPSGILGAEGMTGTEYEFAEAIRGRTERGLPDLLVYRKRAKAYVLLDEQDRIHEAAAQKAAVEQFFESHFYGANKTLVAAFHEFNDSATFEEHVEHHLIKLIEKRLQLLGLAEDELRILTATWTQGSPFRGLDLFEFEHEPIFFGRTRAVSEIVRRLRNQSMEGRAFVLVLGPSGSGKSSLVRAGVLPMLSRPGVIPHVAHCRRAIFRPSDSTGDLFDGLAVALLRAEAIPELTADGTTVAEIAGMLREYPSAAQLLIKGALSQASAALKPAQPGGPQPEARLLFVVDQLEELFTLDSVTPEQRRGFAACLKSLASSGRTWVIATLRSDFYTSLGTIADLVELKSGDGQFDLEGPAAAEIGQMIRLPAEAAALRFEVDQQTGERLEDVLRDAAVLDPDSLPLLEFTLEELYQRRSKNLLTFAAYQELGKLEGAIARRAETIYQDLSEEVRATLPQVFRQLVTVSPAEDTPTRKQSPRAGFESDPAQGEFVRAFVAARLLISDQTADGTPVIRITHESLLLRWERLRAWLVQDRELLQIRARVSAAAHRWSDGGKHADFLLSSGKPLEEARYLSRSLPFAESTLEDAFLKHSVKKQARHRRLKQSMVAGLVALTVAACLMGLFALNQRGQAERHREIAEQKARAEQQARVLADRRKQEAEWERSRAVASEAEALQLAKRNANLVLLEGEARKLAEQKSRDEQMAREIAEQKTQAEAEARHFAELKANEALRGRYITQLARVQDVIESNPDLALSLLGSEEECPPAVRDFTWDHLYHQAFAGGQRPVDTAWWNALLAEHGFCRAVAFIPGHKQLALGWESGAIALVDTVTFQVLHVLREHPAPIVFLRCAADGARCVSASEDGRVCLWDLPSRQLARKFEVEFPLLGAAWDLSADGRRLAVVSNPPPTPTSEGDPADLNRPPSRPVQIWDVLEGNIEATIVAPGVCGVALSRDGRSLATVEEDNEDLRTVRLYVDGSSVPGGEPPDADPSQDAPSAQRTPPNAAWPMKRQSGIDLDEAPRFIAFSPDGEAVAIEGGLVETDLGSQGVVHFWQIGPATPAEEMERAPTLRFDRGRIESLCFSEDGKVVATGGSDGTIGLWDPQMLQSRFQEKSVAGPLVAVTLAADGSMLFAFNQAEPKAEFRALAAMGGSWRSLADEAMALRTVLKLRRLRERAGVDSNLLLREPAFTAALTEAQIAYALGGRKLAEAKLRAAASEAEARLKMLAEVATQGAAGPFGLERVLRQHAQVVQEWTQTRWGLLRIADGNPASQASSPRFAIAPHWVVRTAVWRLQNLESWREAIRQQPPPEEPWDQVDEDQRRLIDGAISRLQELERIEQFRVEAGPGLPATLKRVQRHLALLQAVAAIAAHRPRLALARLDDAAKLSAGLQAIAEVRFETGVDAGDVIATAKAQSARDSLSVDALKAALERQHYLPHLLDLVDVPNAGSAYEAGDAQKDLLKERSEALAELANIAKAMLDEGVGRIVDHARLASDHALAEADFAWANGDRAKTLQWLEAAAKHEETHAQACAAMAEVGTLSADEEAGAIESLLVVQLAVHEMQHAAR